MILGYIRVSTEKQDLEKQRHLLLEFANSQKMIIDEFIDVEISSKRDTKVRRIEELQEKLNSGDTLIVAELSRLGRNMLETLNLIHSLAEKGITILFVRQPELSTKGPQEKLLLAIYSYFAETEREFISVRTKQGLEAAKAKGVRLGRPKGSKNVKSRRLDPFRDQIKQFLIQGVTMRSISKIIIPQMGEDAIGYNSFIFYIKHDLELKKIHEKNP